MDPGIGIVIGGVVGVVLIGALFMSKKKEESEEPSNGSLHGYQGGRSRRHKGSRRKGSRRTKRVKI
jgi:hypothetical protein